METNAILIDPKDNVATLVTGVAEGERAAWPGGEVVAVGAVEAGHKVAIRAIDEGAEVLKYGQPIGRAARAIRAGEHVHTHNIAREGEEEEA